MKLKTKPGLPGFMVLMLFLFSSGPLIFAQVSTIKGTVKVSDQVEPATGVTIVVKGSSNGTITDLNGNYSIKAQASDTLVFSFVGYEKTELAVGSQTVIDVTLQVESKAIDEIVVIGYGTVKKSDLTGSVSSVKSADITKITSFNPTQSLQGKIAGVQITSLSGAPGAGAVVRIRGTGTFNNSSPIYVVDGIILDDISFLNSSDIASMEVLKDASATAIYGSRGANGVIMVTTKSGSVKGMTVFNFSSEYGIQKLTKKIDLLSGSEFGEYTNDITPTYNNVDLLPNTDWQDLVFHAAPMQNHQFSASGGSNTSTYYVGIGYFKQDGIIDKSGYERLTIKLNNTYKLTNAITFGNNITLAPYKQQNAPNVTYAVYRAQPIIEPYRPDGYFAEVRNVGNPLADLEYSNSFNKGLRGVGNFYGEATILKGFKLKSSFGIDAGYNKSESFTPAFQVSSQQQNPLSVLRKGNNELLSWLWENTANYYKEIGKSTFDIVAGYTMQETMSENFGITGKNIIRDNSNFWYISAANIYDPNNSVNTLNKDDLFNDVDPNLNYSMISYLFRTNYTYDGKYILTATFRRDGSSKFKEGNRYGNYPSFAAGWNIGKESFMENINLISTLKLRGSWGKMGNEKIPYTSRFSAVNADLSAIFGLEQTANPGATYAKSGNENLKWETTTQADLGLEAGILDNKLTAEFDYYHKVTDDILIELSTPGHLGNGQGQKIRYNAASILNSGFEFNLRWREKIGEFSYNIGLLGSTLHNEILEVGGNSGIDSVLYGGELGNGIPVTQSRVGLPVGSFFGYKTNGIFQSVDDLSAYPHATGAGPGDLIFVDTYRDSIINDRDRTFLGSPIPKFVFGFNFGFEFRSFDFSADIQGQTGNKIFNGKEVVRPDPYTFEKHVVNRWTGPGTSNTEPRASWGGYNYIPSDWFVQDGSFIRLRNVSIGYTLPQSLINRISANSLRVYVKGSNLYTLTKFTGYTPEIGGDILSNGIDNGIYPVTSVYSVGLNLIF